MCWKFPTAPTPRSRVQMAPPNSTLDKLFAAGGYGAVIAIAHASTLVKDKRYEQYARRGGFTVNAIDEAKALARRNPGISEETLATGMLSSSPAIPDDDLDTIGLQWLLVAQSRMSTTTAGDLARAIYENKAELALDDGFASRIEPADTDKDAFIVAHQGAAEYINDDTKSFMDRYSDLMYLGAGALSIIGSIFAAHLHQDHPGRAGEGQRTRNRHSRYRRADRARQFAGCARSPAGRTRSDPSRRGDRLARRHASRPTGWIPSSSAMNSCATRSACAAII